MYLGLDDEGAPYAHQLMRQYLLGGGDLYLVELGEGAASGHYLEAQVDGVNWQFFMQSRPEIEEAVRSHMEQYVLSLAESGPGVYDFNTQTEAVLRELPSMQFTLHGTSQLEISGSAFVRSHFEGGLSVDVTIRELVWNDVGDLHSGISTPFVDGRRIPDDDFMGIGAAFPIEIHFYPRLGGPASSSWLVEEGVAIHLSGYPEDAHLPYVPSPSR